MVLPLLSEKFLWIKFFWLFAFGARTFTCLTSPIFDLYPAAFTCSRLTTETLEQAVTSFWCLCCYLQTNLTPCSSVSVVNFEHVNASWVEIFLSQFSRRSQNRLQTSKMESSATNLAVIYFCKALHLRYL